MTGVSINPNPRRYAFLPINRDWQERVAGLFGTRKPTQNLYAETDTALELLNQCPKRDGLKNVIGDGACLPRVISLAIYGVETYHHQLRQALVKFMLNGPVPGESSPRGAAFHARMREMKKRKTWMATEEVRGFAYMLDTPIFTLVQYKDRAGRVTYSWQRVPHQSFRENVNNVRGIYILNANDHFQLIKKPITI